VLCALRKEPHRRYATVERFADDLARYLDGRPVAARGDSLRYRALKFVRRHRVGLATVTVTSAALLLGGIGIWWQRTLAREEAATARRITELLLDTFAAAEPGETSYGNACALVDRAAAHVDAYHLQGLTRATLLQSLGRIYHNLGEREAAEVRYREALRLREAELGRIHIDTAATLTQLASLLTYADRFAEAEVMLHDALQAARAVPPGEVLVRTLDAWGNWCSTQRRHGEAIAAFEEALAVGHASLAKSHLGLAATMNNFGVACWRSGDLVRAGDLLRQALAIRVQSPQGQQTSIALLHHNLGVLAVAQRDFAGAQPLLERALELREQIFTATHPQVAHTLHALGELFVRSGTPTTAEPVLRRCLTIQRAALPGDWRTGDTMSLLAECLLDLDRVAEAGVLLREALPVIVAKLPEDHEHVCEVRQRWSRWVAMTKDSGR
jgi:tetratricopeptide (TPR) repeat protein